jgi:voltage-gated potassium channel
VTGLALGRRTRGRVYHALEVEAGDRGFERALNVSLLALIVVNVVAVILETVRELRARYGPVFDALETFSIAVFTLEYALRVWTCVEDPRYRRPVRGRLAFLASPLALVDLVAILPAYVPGDVFLDLRYARILRLLRMLRILKVTRYSRAMQTFLRVAAAKRGELVVIMAFLVVLLVLASSSMYYAEYEEQPEAFSSIPQTMWWAIATLTTVGYGDVVPRTAVGRLLGGVIAILGIGFFALPAGVLAAAFAEEVGRPRGDDSCPRCGRSG